MKISFPLVTGYTQKMLKMEKYASLLLKSDSLECPKIVKTKQLWKPFGDRVNVPGKKNTFQ